MGFRTIRGKLLFSFLIFLLITFCIILSNVWFNTRKDKSQAIISKLAYINLKNQTAKKLELDFLVDETINSLFYESKKSEYLNERNKNIFLVNESLYWLKINTSLKSDESQQSIQEVIQLAKLYEQKFKEFVQLIEKRGFKDYGMEGEMRKNIRNLESFVDKYKLNLAKLLTIRRHEKDFIIRKEESYVQKNLQAIADFQKDIDIKVQNLLVKQKFSEVLNAYENSFLELVQTEQLIGFNNKAGIRKELIDITKKEEVLLQKLNDAIYTEIGNISKQGAFVSSFIIALCIFLIIFLGFYITNILSKPITKLSASIHQVIESDFSKEIEIQKINSKDEIGKLSNDFGFMLAQMQSSFELVEAKTRRIEEKQRLLVDSINYAKKIQEAILPEIDDMNQFFKEHFIIYQPVHTVSGDFYWLTEINRKVFFAVVDCTGHGVPGAFMSMIGNTLLNKILKEKQIHDPSFILEVLDIEIKIALHQEQNKNNDGMEVSLCMIEGLLEEQEMIKITFAGAKGKLFYSQHGELHKIKGTRRAIGGNVSEKNDKSVAFENHTVEIETGNCIYLSSDGLCDQPDENRKKYGTKRFLNLLQSNINAPLEVQYQKLIEDLHEFNPDLLAQRDDITVIGLKI